MNRSVYSVPVKLDGLPRQRSSGSGQPRSRLRLPDGDAYESATPGPDNQNERVYLQAGRSLHVEWRWRVLAALDDAYLPSAGLCRDQRWNGTNHRTDCGADGPHGRDFVDAGGGRVDARDVGHCSNEISEDRLVHEPDQSVYANRLPVSRRTSTLQPGRRKTRRYPLRWATSAIPPMVRQTVVALTAESQ